MHESIIIIKTRGYSFISPNFDTFNIYLLSALVTERQNMINHSLPRMINN